MWCQSLSYFTWVIQSSSLTSNEPFPLFMTSAKRELIDSAVFFDFFVGAGAIVAIPRPFFESPDTEELRGLIVCLDAL